jgi:hypothetical protein
MFAFNIKKIEVLFKIQIKLSYLNFKYNIFNQKLPVLRRILNKCFSSFRDSSKVITTMFKRRSHDRLSWDISHDNLSWDESRDSLSWDRGIAV